MVRAVLFDLDDTLFDHKACARVALSHLHGAHEAFASRPFDEFERLHAGFLEELHRRVLAGELPLDAAREERFRRLFEASGVTPEPEVVVRAAAAYRDGYQKVRRPVPGAARLLELVKARARVAIVSNNLLEEQREKLRQCRFDRFVDVLVVSEEAGVSKPDPRIFEITLERLGCAPGDVVMVGDSWAADVIGGNDAGIRTVWFNPAGRPPPDDSADVPQLRSLEPPDEALALIFDDRSRSASGSAGDPPARHHACE
jgi:putative hydrolase of the HAD superfamily